MDGQNLEQQLARAESLLRLGRTDEALGLLGRMDRRLPAVLLLTGIARLLQGDPERAVAELGRYTALCPGDASGFGHLGNAHQRRGNFRSAVAAFQRAVALRPDIAEFHFNLGNAVQGLGDREAACDAYAAAIRARPGYAKAFLRHGGLLLDMGRTGEAAELFSQAVEAIPTDADLRFGLCQALAAHGLMDQAQEAAGQARLAKRSLDALERFARSLAEGPYFPNLQGKHAPERQVYMSTTVFMQAQPARPLSILEIGSFMGASMITWARALERFCGGRGEIVCIDPWEEAETGQYAGSMATGLASGSAQRLFLHAAGFVPDGVTVTPLRGTSGQVLPTLSGRRFDIIYIDGCHLHPEVLEDIRACDALLETGGILCGDDLECQLHEVDAEQAARNARVDFIRDPATGIGFHPGVTLGVGQFFGPVGVHGGFWSMRKTADGYRPVSPEGKGLAPRHWPPELAEQARARVEAAGLPIQVL